MQINIKAFGKYPIHLDTTKEDEDKHLVKYLTHVQ